MSSLSPPAILALADGTVFHGSGIGAAGSAVGEVVFNTAMTGYQEILTDPSYCRQIVTADLSAYRQHRHQPGRPGIGTSVYGGLVIRDLPLRNSNWRSAQSLSDYLKAGNIVGIAGIDTRRLTRILRTDGAEAGCLISAPQGGVLAEADVARALAMAREFPGLAGWIWPRWCPRANRTSGTKAPGRWARAIASSRAIVFMSPRTTTA